MAASLRLLRELPNTRRAQYPRFLNATPLGLVVSGLLILGPAAPARAVEPGASVEVGPFPLK